MKRFVGAVGALGAVALASGCHVDQWQQPRLNPLAENDFYEDRQASRPVVDGAVAYGKYTEPDAYHTGMELGKPVKTIPAEAVRGFGGPKAMLERGQDRFNVFCQPCHGALGDGNGFIALRGLGYWQKLPASYQDPKLVKQPDGHFYDVLVHGKGAMYSYATRIPDPQDRWAVVAYVRALQRVKPGAVAAAPVVHEGGER